VEMASTSPKYTQTTAASWVSLSPNINARTTRQMLVL